MSRNRLREVLDEPCLLVNVLQVLYNELMRGQGLRLSGAIQETSLPSPFWLTENTIMNIITSTQGGA